MQSINNGRGAIRRGIHMIFIAIITPLLEKNPAKIASFRLPLVFSMARLIILGFAIGVLHEIWRAGVVGWPEATLAMAIVLALPILGALERVPPGDALKLGGALLERFGVGPIRGAGSVFSREPSKHDDHRSDDQ